MPRTGRTAVVLGETRTSQAPAITLLEILLLPLQRSYNCVLHRVVETGDYKVRRNLLISLVSVHANHYSYYSQDLERNGLLILFHLFCSKDLEPVGFCMSPCPPTPYQGSVTVGLCMPTSLSPLRQVFGNNGLLYLLWLFLLQLTES